MTFRHHSGDQCKNKGRRSSCLCQELCPHSAPARVPRGCSSIIFSSNSSSTSSSTSSSSKMQHGGQPALPLASLRASQARVPAAQGAHQLCPIRCQWALPHRQACITPFQGGRSGRWDHIPWQALIHQQGQQRRQQTTVRVSPFLSPAHSHPTLTPSLSPAWTVPPAATLAPVVHICSGNIF